MVLDEVHIHVSFGRQEGQVIRSRRCPQAVKYLFFACQPDKDVPPNKIMFAIITIQHIPTTMTNISIVVVSLLQYYLLNLIYLNTTSDMSRVSRPDYEGRIVSRVKYL
jgi:hypothetical protein